MNKPQIEFNMSLGEDKGTWTRTCQECGTKTTRFKEPDSKRGPSDAYLNAKCKHCKSEALDYGSLRFVKPFDEDEE